jgi:hypothetical protein
MYLSKKNILQAILRQQLLIAVFACGFLFLPVQAKNVSAPTLEIVSPKPGQMFKMRPIFVNVKVANFKLIPPEEYWADKAQANVGHIHVSLDKLPLFATSNTQIMIGDKINGFFLDTGEHVLTVELVLRNHRSLNPPIKRTVKFITAH